MTVVSSVDGVSIQWLFLSWLRIVGCALGYALHRILIPGQSAVLRGSVVYTERGWRQTPRHIDRMVPS